MLSAWQDFTIGVYFRLAEIFLWFRKLQIWHILHQSPVFIGHGLCCRTFWSRSWRMRWTIPPVTSQHRQACKTLERANATGPDRQKPENQKGPAVVAVAGPWPLHSERLWGSGNTNCLAHPGQFQCFFLSNTVKSQVLQILHMLKHTPVWLGLAIKSHGDSCRELALWDARVGLVFVLAPPASLPSILNSVRVSCGLSGGDSAPPRQTPRIEPAC